MVAHAVGDESQRSKKSTEAVYEHYRSAEDKRLSGSAKATVSPLPMESVDYLRMSLELSPTEYMNTSRDLYETAMAFQSARAQGINDARDEDRKRKERDAKSAASMQKLKGR